MFYLYNTYNYVLKPCAEQFGWKMQVFWLWSKNNLGNVKPIKCEITNLPVDLSDVESPDSRCAQVTLF